MATSVCDKASHILLTSCILSILSVLAFANDTSAASTISVTSSGAQSINVRPDVNNNGVGASIGVDEITVNTTCRAGYNFSISTSVNDNNLYLNGSSSNNQTGKYFTPADGTTALSNATNTWGYYFNSSAPTTAPTASNIFQPVPTLSSTAATIKTPATTASTTDISDSFNIYYGVSASSNLAPGTYKMIPDSNNANANGVITYYVTMDTSCDINTISYNANNGSGAINPQEVQNGDSVALADNAFTRSNHYFMGWSTNQNATTPEYRTNQTITPTSNMTLYAVWGDSTAQPLYNTVASLTRGNQTNDTNATTGIKTNPTKATSGVWTYNSSVFGTASDASTSNPIYYYRGILDATTGSYGSNGDAMDYPNYVKMTTGSNTTCWRIVRTTGSGGVKMIYNGIYSATTSGSCANATTNTQLTTSVFNATSNVENKSIIAVGYTFNSNYKTTTASTTAGNLFGTNSSYTGNNTRSTIKTYIEDTWYASNMTSWTSKLEASAGYCNDRSIYDTSNNLLSDTTSISTPYTTATSGITQYNFGARQRNHTTTQAPSLTCPYNARDLYRYVASSTGVSNQLKYPAALLTADELSFAGSGNSTASNGSGYNTNAYLSSGSSFWLLSPNLRSSASYAGGYYLNSGGYLNGNNVGSASGVRPAISLASGTTAVSGSGTATDPWVIEEPKAMQDLTLSQCQKNVGANGNASGVGDEISVYDKRDGSGYTVRYINDACWMTQNLRITKSTGQADWTISSTDSNFNNVSTWNVHVSDLTAGNSYTEARSHVPTATDADTNGNKPMDTYTANQLGVWYNFCAVSANNSTGCNGSGNYTPGTGTVTGDICPAGWHLPTSYSIISYSSAFSPIYGGLYYNGSLSDTTTFGHWWSATAYNAYNQYSLYYYNGSLDTDRSNKRYGFYVRCVRTS